MDDCFIRRILTIKCIERKVPLNIWPEMEETLTNYSNGGGKEQFCSLNGFKHEPGVLGKLRLLLLLQMIVNGQC